MKTLISQDDLPMKKSCLSEGMSFYNWRLRNDIYAIGGPYDKVYAKVKDYSRFVDIPESKREEYSVYLMIKYGKQIEFLEEE